MRAALVLIAAGLVIAACEVPPTYNGKSLLCEQHSDCPTGLRCYEQTCIRNSPPTLTPFAPVIVQIIDAPLSLTASAADPEGDAVTFTWTQRRGPAVLVDGAGVTGPTLTVTPSVLGMYELEVQATDEFAGLDDGPDSAKELVRVLVRPAIPTIYVSDLGSDGADPLSELPCGDFATPCRTIGRGLERLRADSDGGPSQILLAATTTPDPYTECIDLRDGETLLGCFDPTDWSWTYQAGLRGRCRVRCDTVAGHRTSGAAVLRDVSLSMADSVRPSTVTDPVATLRIDGGTAQVEDVDVETAACGRDCWSIGVLSVAAAPTLTRIEVTGGTAGFDPLNTLAGFAFLHGSGIIAGSPAVRAADDGGRGGVTLNAPATALSFGILAFNAEITVTGMAIEGGLGPSLAGIAVAGGSVDARGNRIALSGFGTRSVAGVEAFACTSDDDCGCNETLEECGGPVTPTEVYAPRVTLEDNDITVDSGAGVEGLVPCFGAGISLDGAADGAAVANNTVAVGDSFTLSLGVMLANAPAAGAVSAGASVAANAVTVGSAATDPFCSFLNLERGEDFSEAAIGLALFGVPTATLANNTVDVGTNEELSAGLYLLGGERHAVTANIITAGEASPLTTARVAFGAVLAHESGSGSFSRNRVAVGAGAENAQALYVVGDQEWEITNNFVFGGDAPHSTGLQILAPGAAGPLWPRVAHNTIVGGGTASLVSTAVSFAASDAAGATTSAGRLENNLLDAGGASGRRFLFNNLGFFATRRGNVAQLTGTAAGPRPAQVFSVGDAAIPSGAGTDLQARSFAVLMSRSAEVTGLHALEVSSFGLIEGASQALASPPLFGWVGTVDSKWTLVTTATESVAVAKVDNGEATPFVVYPAVQYAGGTTITHRPVAAVLAEVSGRYPADIVFIERRRDAVPGGLWIMAGQAGGGYQPPAPSSLTLDDPTVLAAAPQWRSNAVLVGDGTRLYLYSGSAAPAIADVAVVPKPGGGTTNITGVRAAAITSFQLTIGDRAPDLLLLTDQGLFVMFDAFDDFAAMASWLPQPFQPGPPCGGDPSAITTFAVGERGGFEPGEIAVGCANGTLEVFAYDSIAFAFDRKAQIAPPSDIPSESRPITSLAVRSLPAFAPNALALVMVLRRGHNAAELYVTNHGALFGSAQRHTFLVDVAMRDGASFVPDFTSLGAAGINLVPASAACDLAFRNGGAPFDLHLGADAATCIDAGAVLDPAVADDFDAGDSRSDAAPDVGADELP